MEQFFQAHVRLMNTPEGAIHRSLLDKIDDNARMICIRGTRGIGKTTFLLDYARKHYTAECRSCLYLNLNHFYFAEHTIYDLASEFYRQGGRLLLLDQVFKYPQWASDLLKLYRDFEELRIMFTASSVMNMEEDFPELKEIVHCYDLKGISLREYLNHLHGKQFSAITLDELIQNHQMIAARIANEINPIEGYKSYLVNGYYPPQSSSHFFQESLVKNMNMILEVDVVYIRQIEPTYLHKLRELFYLVATQERPVVNISSLSNEIGTSRATVTNYLRYLADAGLIRQVYKEGHSFPKKPDRIYIHDTNIASVLYPMVPTAEMIRNIFFLSQVEGTGHKVEVDKQSETLFHVEGKHPLKLVDIASGRGRPDGATYVVESLMVGNEEQIPLWLFGFLY